MATVTTPVGQVLTGVSGAELEYYRGEANTHEGYVIVEDDLSLPAVAGVEQAAVEDESVDEIAADESSKFRR